MGFVASPHTSSGRVPTPKGYRLFVDTLLTVRPLEEVERAQIEGSLLPDDRTGWWPPPRSSCGPHPFPACDLPRRRDPAARGVLPPVREARPAHHRASDGEVQNACWSRTGPTACAARRGRQRHNQNYAGWTSPRSRAGCAASSSTCTATSRRSCAPPSRRAARRCTRPAAAWCSRRAEPPRGRGSLPGPGAAAQALRPLRAQGAAPGAPGRERTRRGGEDLHRRRLPARSARRVLDRDPPYEVDGASSAPSA